MKLFCMVDICLHWLGCLKAGNFFKKKNEILKKFSSSGQIRRPLQAFYICYRHCIQVSVEFQQK